MRLRILNICFFSLAFMVNACAVKTQQNHEIKLLIIDGFSNHDWQRTTKTIVHLLNMKKGFKIDVSTSPDHTASKETIESWNPDFSAYDVVMMNCNDIYNPVNWSTVTRQNLERFVASGGGLYIFHSANNGFVNWVEYNKMIGLGWRTKSFGKAAEIQEDGTIKVIEAGDGENTSHGARVNALVHRIGNHPIQKGLPRSWIYADIEIYTFARGPMENMTVLTYAKDALYNKNFPIEWVVKYGKGNVYNSTLGHFWNDQQNPEGMRCAAFQTEMVRAIQWLAKAKVDTSVPNDFPGTTAPSLRDNLTYSILYYPHSK
ncbi:MAG: ThuA domain-containing protein [Bacteroidales bacterium]